YPHTYATGKPEKTRHNGHRHQHEAVHHTLNTRETGFFFAGRQHTNACAVIIIKSDPCDGPEVRELLEELKGKQYPSAGLKTAGSRYPANKRGQCTGYCPYE